MKKIVFFFFLQNSIFFLFTELYGMGDLSLMIVKPL